jgi:hypothetical protein
MMVAHRSKALVLWRRTLLTLAPLILPSYWDSIADPVQTACFADNGALIAQLSLLNPAPPGAAASLKVDGQAAAAASDQQQQHGGSVHALPAGVLVTQADVEAALVAVLLDKFGITVQRNTSLSAFTVADDNGSVLCTLKHTSSSSGDSSGTAEEQIRASYLVGCDGGRSAVRKMLGLQFTGTTLDQRFLLGDFKYDIDEMVNAAHKPQHPCEGSLQHGTLLVSQTDVGLVGLIPLGKHEREIRVVWNAGGSAAAHSSVVFLQPLQCCQGNAVQPMHESVGICRCRACLLNLCSSTVLPR